MNTYIQQENIAENVKLEDRSLNTKIMLKYRTRGTFILRDAMNIDLGRIEDRF
jgi:hypothetical protein